MIHYPLAFRAFFPAPHRSFTRSFDADKGAGGAQGNVYFPMPPQPKSHYQRNQ